MAGFFSRNKKSQHKNEEVDQKTHHDDGRKHKKKKHRDSKKRKHGEKRHKSKHTKKSKKHHRRRSATNTEQQQPINYPPNKLLSEQPLPRESIQQQQPTFGDTMPQQNVRPKTPFPAYLVGHRGPKSAPKQPQKYSFETTIPVSAETLQPPSKRIDAGTQTPMPKIDESTTGDLQDEDLRRDTVIKCIVGIKSFVEAMKKEKPSQFDVKISEKLLSNSKQPFTSETIEDQPSKKSEQVQLKTAEALEKKAGTIESLESKSEHLKTAEHLDDYVFNKVPLKEEKHVEKTYNLNDERDEPSNRKDLPEYYFRHINSEEHLSVRLNSNPRCRHEIICADHNRVMECNLLKVPKRTILNRTNRLPASDKRGLDLGWYKKISTNSKTHIHCVRRST